MDCICGHPIVANTPCEAIVEVIPCKVPFLWRRTLYGLSTRYVGIVPIVTLHYINWNPLKSLVLSS